MSEELNEQNEPKEIYWSELPKYNRPFDWDNTITIPVGIYDALEAVEMAAEALDYLDKSADFDDVRKEKALKLFEALQHYRYMKTMQRSKGLLGVFSWETKK